MVSIIVTGTPGTGKTTVAMRLAKHTGFTYIDVNKIIAKYKISEGYDRKKKCKIIDTKKLNAKLKKIIKEHKNTIIDSHLSHFLPKSAADLCIITRCNLKLLKSRLKRRDYSKDKIEENMEAEIMEVIPNEVAKKGHKYVFVDTDKKVDYKKLEKKIKKIVS